MTQLQVEYQKLQKDYANLEEQKRLHDADIAQKRFENQKILSEIQRIFQDIAYSQTAQAAIPYQTAGQLIGGVGNYFKGVSSLGGLFA